ncbi:MAG: bifunctional aspartate kinase/homoserine dehydrogenase I [Chitinophagaceae bacterium]
MDVLKFGGTSVANATNIKKVIEIISQPKYSNSIVVVSALSGVTDLLIQAAVDASISNGQYIETLNHLEQKHIDCVVELIPTNNEDALKMVMENITELKNICEGIYRLGELTNRIKDKVVSFGEFLSSKIISAYLSSINLKHQWIDSREVIITDNNFGNAVVDFEKTNPKINLKLQTSNFKLCIAPGFVASNETGVTTTLGRGGSDYTAAIFAGAVNAENLEIWTDVSGMMTADPRWVTNVKNIQHTSYKEAMELSHFGAKVIYPPTIQPAMQKNIPIWIKNTFEPNAYGTRISASVESDNKADEMISGISSINHISLLSLEGSGMVGIPGFSKRLFEALALEKVNVILITQSSSEHSICVGVNTVDVDKAKKAVDAAFDYEIATGKVEPLVIEKDLSIVAVVGDKMKNHQGISGKMFSALGRNGINIRAIAQGSSERNISAVVGYSDVKKAVNVLHEAFFESSKKQLNIFIAGVGNVGAKLVSQLQQQSDYLLSNLNIQVKICGIANSKQMLVNEDGIDLQQWLQYLQQAPSSTINDYVDTIIKHNLRNSVFVDVSASSDVASVYGNLLERSIAVVACNKIAASSTYNNYAHLKHLCKEFDAPFLFETNVGAGLPVIDTLNNLIKSGDRIRKMQAVLSGTLNFVFNNYDATKPFAEVVKQAQDEGYTEPDPRLDLGGTDVMRKIMILAREAGEQMEMSEITKDDFLPQECYAGSVDDFYKSMLKNEEHFKTLYNEANAKGCKLKFVASFIEGKASVGLQHINPQSDFYHLYGKDNIVLFYTDRYPENPLVVKGAGAGADVTASGVFADIIKLAK